jgi:hypothetical protein
VTAQLPSWLLALGLAAAMLSLGMNLGVFARPYLTTCCGARRRIVRQGRVCRGTDPHRH